LDFPGSGLWPAFFCVWGEREESVMRKIEIILNEMEEFPEPLLDEVLDFVTFLKSKMVSNRMENALLSESSLKKDWLQPEEDDAWQNL
jgi:hypothetical protein